MNIIKNIAPFIVSCDDTVGFALKKINQNTKRLVFSVKENGVLEGLMTDGDFRRWVVRAENVDLSIPVSQISNKNIVTGLENDNSQTLQSFFNSKVTAVPLLDHLNRITAIVWNEDLRLRIGDFIIGNSMPSFLIAEIGNNHNGSISQGKNLVEAAAASDNVTTDEDAVTFVPEVTKAAFASATVPEIAIAFDTVTVPVVSLPIVLRSVARIAVALASLIVAA